MLLLHRFSIPSPHHTGEFEPRWWNVTNRAIRGPGGEVELIIHSIDDVTAFVRAERSGEAGGGAHEDAQHAPPEGRGASGGRGLVRTRGGHGVVALLAVRGCW